MNRASFNEMLEYGQKFETMATKHLINKGYFVTPKYLYSGKDNNEAPVMFGNGRKIVIPDIDAAKSGQRIWVECKRKKRMFKYPATGFSMRLYSHYNEVQNITGSPIFFIFWDETNGNEFYGNFLNSMKKHIFAENFNIENEPYILFKYPQAFLKFDFDLENNFKAA